MYLFWGGKPAWPACKIKSSNFNEQLLPLHTSELPNWQDDLKYTPVGFEVSRQKLRCCLDTHLV